VTRAALAIAVLALGCSSSSSQPREPRATGGGDRGLVAFETMRVVFQHPRCQNCHPAGDAPLQGDASIAHAQNVKRGPAGRGNVGLECTTCHGAANTPDTYGGHVPPGSAVGWRMPTPEQPMVFVGATPHALCEQLKDPNRNGGRDLAAVRTHLDDPLVQWGWAPGVGRVPVPIARAEFLAAFETWVAAGAPCPP